MCEWLCGWLFARLCDERCGWLFARLCDERFGWLFTRLCDERRYKFEGIWFELECGGASVLEGEKRMK